MDPAPTFRVTYWGVTGSYPRPLSAAELKDSVAHVAAAEFPLTYGGDTTCLQVSAGELLLVVDAGSGLRLLSQRLMRDSGGRAVRGTMLLTHAHFDHLSALPFFEPFYDAGSEFILRAAPRVLNALERLGHPASDLAGVFLPLTLEQMPGLNRCEAIEAGESFECGDVRVSTMALNHPGGSLAYRFERGGKSIVVATDHEQPETPDTTLAEFALGAELLYMDAQYLRREYEGQAGIGDEAPQCRIGWGHTPLEDCLSTARAAGVKRLHLGHHEPRRTDAMLRDLDGYASQLARAASLEPCEVRLAYQGLVVEI